MGTRGCCLRNGSSQSSGLPLRLATERSERGKLPALASFTGIELLRQWRNAPKEGLDQ
jgi:hypothetical protein